MAREATGGLRFTAGAWQSRVRIDDTGKRRSYRLIHFAHTDEAGADERSRALAEIALRLRRAGRFRDVDKVLRRAGDARPGKAWEAILHVVEKLTSGAVQPIGRLAHDTVASFGKAWRDGTLRARYPEQ